MGTHGGRKGHKQVEGKVKDRRKRKHKSVKSKGTAYSCQQYSNL